MVGFGEVFRFAGGRRRADAAGYGSHGNGEEACRRRKRRSGRVEARLGVAEAVVMEAGRGFYSCGISCEDEEDGTCLGRSGGFARVSFFYYFRFVSEEMTEMTLGFLDICARGSKLNGIFWREFH